MVQSLLEAQVIIEEWRMEYNGLRPHSSLGGIERPTSLRRATALRDCGRGLRPPSVTKNREKQQQQTNGRTLLLNCPAFGSCHYTFRGLLDMRIPLSVAVKPAEI
jgi:Integrase core domain